MNDNHGDRGDRSAIFAEEFPSLHDVLIEYRAARPEGAFQKNLFGEDRRLPTTKISLRTAGPIAHCLNPKCCNGGHDVTALVKDMLRRGEKEWQGRVHCTGRGWEPDRSWEKCRRCEWAWDFRITLIGKNEKGREWYQ